MAGAGEPVGGKKAEKEMLRQLAPGRGSSSKPQGLAELDPGGGAGAEWSGDGAAARKGGREGAGRGAG